MKTRMAEQYRPENAISLVPRFRCTSAAIAQYWMICSKRQRGFTLVELLVVIAIIGILVALLLPAIQAAREASRRATCQSNMKNVALAVLNYTESAKRLPIGMSFDAAKYRNKVASALAEYGPNWII